MPNAKLNGSRCKVLNVQCRPRRGRNEFERTVMQTLQD